MDIRRHARVLWASRYLVAVTVVAALAVAALLTFLPARKWSASSTLQVQPAAALAGGTVRPDDVSYLDRLINTYSEIVASPEFADSVARSAKLTVRPVLAVRSPENTNLVAVEATTPTAQSAASVANIAGRELVARIRRANDGDLSAADDAFQNRATALETAIARAQVQLADLRQSTQTPRVREVSAQLREQIDGLRTSMSALRNERESQRSAQTARAGTVAMVAQAATPTAPVSRRAGLVLPLGLLFGLIAGCGLALAADGLTRRFRSEGEIEEALDVPVLATIPRDRRVGANLLFDEGSREHEAVQRLRTQLLLADRARTHRVLIVSAHRDEGKSTLAANLARSVADSGRTVMLVDADMRLPSTHRYFGEDNRGGLSDLLTRSPPAEPLSWRELARTTDHPGLAMLHAGGEVRDPPTLLASPAMSALLDELAREFDMVIIDSPALLAVSDALVLAPLVDAVILVASSSISPDALRLTNQQLRRVGAAPFGLVVNGFDEANLSHYVDYYADKA